MLQINIVSGKTAGTFTVARRFPFRIGRSDGTDLRLEDPGVWKAHLTLDLSDSGEFVFTSHEKAPLLHNGRAAEAGTLASGDILEVGAVKLQVQLSPTEHRDFRFREAAVWTALTLLGVIEVWTIYWVLAQ